jgi:hypothetical protein
MFSVENYLGTSYDRNLVWVPYYLSDKGFLGLLSYLRHLIAHLQNYLELIFS